VENSLECSVLTSEVCEGELETTFHLVAGCDYYTAGESLTWTSQTLVT